MVFRVQRNILRVIFRRISFGISIHSENGTISGMSWPFPVIDIASEFSYARGSCAYGSYIFIILINEIIKFIPVKEIPNNYGIFSVLGIFSLNGFIFSVDDGFALFFRHSIVQF